MLNNFEKYLTHCHFILVLDMCSVLFDILKLNLKILKQYLSIFISGTYKTRIYLVIVIKLKLISVGEK